MEAVGKLLPAIFKRQMRRDDARLVELLLPFWQRAAGRGIAENSTPVHFGAGTLTLETTCPTWAIQLRTMTEEIRAGINNFMGAPIVKTIRVQLSPNLGQREPEIIPERFREAEAMKGAAGRAAIRGGSDSSRVMGGMKAKVNLRGGGRLA
jgi:predicted nucleic acid-binding Zn ribbon protein